MSSTEPGSGARAEVRAYIGYLDKEMTIMAALSAFAIASVALVVGGGGAQLLAGLYFYLQRSNLAWMYGQICLTLVPDGHPDGVTTRSAIIQADSWSTWVPYRIAFAWLCLGYAMYGVALLNQISVRAEALWNRSPKFAVAIPFVVIAVGSLIEWRVLNVFATEDHPWCSARADPGILLPRGRKRRRR